MVAMSSPDNNRHIENDIPNLFTWNRDEAVKLRTSAHGALSQTPLTVPEALQKAVNAAPDSIAMVHRHNGERLTWTYRDYHRDVCKAAKSLIKLGLEPFHGVGIIGFNSPEWFITNIAAIYAGGLATGLYTTNTSEACQYVLSNCEANIAIVENDTQLQKILEIRHELPHLKAIVQYKGKIEFPQEDIYSWPQFMEFGTSITDAELKDRVAQLAPNKCCTLIYTSGTTGNPKGVMLSHDNLTWTAWNTGSAAKLNFGKESVISYLPLSHVAAQIVDIYGSIIFAGSVFFAQPDALKGSLGDTLKEVQPTIFLGVPRVWEKMQESIRKAGQQNKSSIRKHLIAWAKSVGLKGNMNAMVGEPLPPGWKIANALVFKKVKAVLGFNRCKYFISAAAPISKETIEYFMSLNIPVTEIYGMSESTGPHTVSFSWDFRIKSVGKTLPGCNTIIEHPDNDGDGEITMNGRNVFMGYLNEETKTKETFNNDGILKTGDVGKIDPKGFLYITGRIKELIITAGGENIAPVLIEDNVKLEIPIISMCMLIGDKQKFLSLLITLKTEIDAESQIPTDRLSKDAIEWCESIGSNAICIGDVIDGKDSSFLQNIQSGIEKANKNAVSNAQKIQKWSILPRDFSIPGGELGPTLKLRRPIVANMYKNTIESFYT